MAAGDGRYSGQGQNLGNTINSRILYLSGLMDQLIAIEAKTSAMTPNSELVKVGDAGSIKLATLETTGLGDYDKIQGYPIGNASLVWNEYTCKYDRALKIVVDDRESRQSGSLATAAAVAAEELRSHIIPEIDATRMAEMYAQVNATAPGNIVSGAAPTQANIFSSIVDGLDHIYDITGKDSGMTVYVDSKLKPKLDKSTEITYMKDIESNGTNVSNVKRTINGAEVVYVPEKRMQTAITLNNGFTNALTDETDLKSVDPTKFGFAPAAAAKKIWFAITSPGACNGVTAINKTGFIPADMSEHYDGDTYKFRLWHDLIIPKQKRQTCYLSVEN